MTINDKNHTLSNAVNKLVEAGFRTPLSDYRRLLNYSNQSRHVINSHINLEDKYDRQIFDFALRRRLSQEPVSHIIGYRDFWKSKFFVNQSVLDPRPETEQIVERVVKDPSPELSILDLGTGTGCLAISIALEKPRHRVFASDISLDAIRVAKFNAKRLGARVNFIHSDWFANISLTFDMIISNPPYIRTRDFFRLPLNIRRFEPRLALDAGEFGLDCIKQIARKLNQYLNPAGTAILEIGIGQKEMVRELFNSHGFKQVHIFMDLEKKERFVCVKKDA
ncbi:MAG: peptide chain release factor N(5)-glutamine methyltransferase [Pseudomonadota bacterium]|nr:peptide chain release factor N(5)-glutamine methyltransferase [Pseudomonadota bacterium]